MSSHVPRILDTSNESITGAVNENINVMRLGAVGEAVERVLLSRI